MASTESLTESLLETFRGIAADVTERPVPEVSADTEIRSLGVDSIALAEIVARIEDRFAIDVPAKTWLSVKTLGDLLDIVERARR
jgi:acyl carrier protein